MSGFNPGGARAWWGRWRGCGGREARSGRGGARRAARRRGGWRQGPRAIRGAPKAFALATPNESVPLRPPVLLAGRVADAVDTRAYPAQTGRISTRVPRGELQQICYKFGMAAVELIVDHPIVTTSRTIYCAEEDRRASCAQSEPMATNCLPKGLVHTTTLMNLAAYAVSISTSVEFTPKVKLSLKETSFYC